MNSAQYKMSNIIRAENDELAYNTNARIKVNTSQIT